MPALRAEGGADRIAQRREFVRAIDPDVGDTERLKPFKAGQEALQAAMNQLDLTDDEVSTCAPMAIVRT